MTIPKVGIILPVRNRWQYTQAILNQLRQQGAMDTGNLVIVVDDGSTDGTPEAIETQFSSVILLRGDGNLWWGGAIAKGMEFLIHHASIDALVWLNDDVFLPDDFLINLQITAKEACQRSGIIGGIAVSNFDSEWIAFGGVFQGRKIRYINEFVDDFISVKVLSGNIVVIPLSIGQKLGLPDISRFPHYGSDYEYTSRAIRSGISVLISRSLRVRVNYTEEDVIRYMPIWMQLYLASKWSGKCKALKDLRSLKSNVNIWTMVNGIHIKSSRVPWWRYEVFYLKKIFQCLFYCVLFQSKAKKTIVSYSSILDCINCKTIIVTFFPGRSE